MERYEGSRSYLWRAETTTNHTASKHGLETRQGGGWIANAAATGRWTVARVKGLSGRTYVWLFEEPKQRAGGKPDCGNEVVSGCQAK